MYDQKLKKSVSLSKISERKAPETHRIVDDSAMQYSPKNFDFSQINLYPPSQRKALSEKFLEKYPKTVDLLQNINLDGNDGECLKQLKENFANSKFEYTMAMTNVEAFLSGKRDGDCKTLATTFQKIAHECLGIKSVKVGYKGKDFFIPNGGKVLDTKGLTGNVDNGKHWAFTNHYWVESSIGNIDLLFLGQEVDQNKWIDQTDEGKEGEIEYRTFGKHKVYMSNFDTITNRYATDLDAAKSGQKEAWDAIKSRTKSGNNSSSLLQRVGKYFFG
jgi:hypothetical protein